MRLRYEFSAPAALLLASGCTAGEDPASLAALIERHTAARGGREAIESVRAIEYRLQISEPTYEVAAVYRADRADRAGRMRVDIYADGERVYSEGYDGAQGWQLPGGASLAEATSPAATAALRHGLHAPGQLYGLHELAALGHRLVLAGRQRIDGQKYFVVTFRFDDGYAADYYINPTNFLIERKRESHALHPDIATEQVRLETRWSDCRAVAGIVRCFKEQTFDLDSGEWMQTATIEEIRSNPELPPDAFVHPSAGASQ